MKSKKRLGIVIHISGSSGNLILRAEGSTKIGALVFDKSGRKIGAVFDIFGPVSSPFVAVKSLVDSSGKYVNEPLFSDRS